MTTISSTVGLPFDEVVFDMYDIVTSQACRSTSITLDLLLYIERHFLEEKKDRLT